MVHVPYKGNGPGITDLVAGQVQVMAPTILSAMPHITSGRMRPYGVTSAKRALAAPELPTVAEAGVPGYEAVQWYGLLAPAGTPRPIVTRLHAEFTKALQQADVKERLLKDGADAVPTSPEEFAAFIRSETVKWAKLAKEVGIQPE
jgi:tripartite-type tricarboxylate transporter receptor subunit TctC